MGSRKIDAERMEHRHIRILGMDLSLTCPAFAVLDVFETYTEGTDGAPDSVSFFVTHMSHVKTDSRRSHGERLADIAAKLDEILTDYERFDIVARERGFSRFNKTTQTLHKVVGVVDLIAAKHGINDVKEFSPTTVKKVITGNGKSEKDEVAGVLKRLVSGADEFATNDESDALAVAVAAYYLAK